MPFERTTDLSPSVNSVATQLSTLSTTPQTPTSTSFLRACNLTLGEEHQARQLGNWEKTQGSPVVVLQKPRGYMPKGRPKKPRSEPSTTSTHTVGVSVSVPKVSASTPKVIASVPKVIASLSKVQAPPTNPVHTPKVVASVLRISRK